MGISRGGVQLRMAEQNLNDAHVDVVLKQVRREGVTQGVGADARPQAGAQGRVPAGHLVADREPGQSGPAIGELPPPSDRRSSLAICDVLRR